MFSPTILYCAPYWIIGNTAAYAFECGIVWLEGMNATALAGIPQFTTKAIVIRPDIQNNIYFVGLYYFLQTERYSSNKSRFS